MIKTLKKFSKKSLAILIALLMIISVMPLTPPISVEAADVSSIQNLKFDKATATGKGYHYGNEATGGYDNILYCSTTTVNEKDFVKVGDNGNFKTFSPNVVVMMYDGTTAGFPITIECYSSSGLFGAKTYSLRNIKWNGNAVFEFRHPWYGYKESDWQSWPGKNDTNKNSDQGYIPVDGSNKDIKMTHSTHRIYNNEVYYKGTGNSTDYYESISGTSVLINVNGKTGSKATSSSIYVIDYNSFYSVVNKVKDIQSKLVSQPNRYTTSSTNSAIDAVVAYYNANQRVKTAFANVNDSNAASTVTSVANDMKNAVAAVNAVNLVCAHSKTRVEGAVPATCVSKGQSGTVYCAYCDNKMEDSYEIDINPNNHANLTTIPAVESTCTATGLTEGEKCTACDTVTVAQQVTEKKPHTEVIDEAVAPTCTKTGLTEGKHCSVCNTVTVAQQVVKALGHNYTPVVTAPTCTAQGYTTYTCSRCNDTYVADYVPAKGHTPAEPVRENVQDSTCTATGSYDEVVYCSVCGAEISRTQKTIEMKAHTWGGWIYDANKQEKRSCTVCDTVDTEKRDCVYVEKSVTPATCIAEGKKVYRCTQCNNEYEEILPVNSEAHNTATREETTNATCTVAGKKETVTYCTLCNKEISRVKTEDIPALGHNYTYTSIDSVSHSVICSRNCNEEGWSYTEKHNIENGECTKCDYVSKVTITFVDENDGVISSDKYNIGAEVVVPELPEQTEEYVGDSQHKVTTYSWNETPQETASQAATYKRVKTESTVACSFGDTATRTETVGKDTYDIFTCTVCKGEMKKRVADKTALNAAIVALQNDLDLPEAGYKYDAARVEAAKALIVEANAIDRYAEQKDVDAMTSELGTAKTTLNAKENLAKYTITVKVENSENADDTEVSKYGKVLENQPYGTTFEHSFEFDKINDGSSLTGLPKYAVYKWMVGDVKLNTTDTSISGVVKGNATYICYVLNFKASTEGATQTTTRVRYLDKSGNTIDFDTAIVGKKYTIKEGVTAPSIPYYEFSGWDCVFGDETNVGTRELVYKATYTYSDSKANVCEIVGLGGVKVNGAERCSAIYDSKVVLTGATKYAFCNADGTTIISYINEDYIYTPRVNETVYIKAVVDEVTTATTAITGNFVQKNAGTLADGVTKYHNLYINAQYYLPEGATAVEAGLVLSKSKSTEEDLQIGKENVTKLASNSQGTNHEYSMAMGFTKDGNVHARSYLIYVDKSGTTHTVYSAVKTIEYKA